jgi:glycosyltransferase involved in cell wall biosynthesis
MKLLIAHNRYRNPGGEDQVFSREVELLRSAGHDVVEYVRHNREISEGEIFGRLGKGMRTVWAWDSARELRSVLRRERPQVAHFHNTFPLISPAAYYTCKEMGVPVVQSLHNPRLMCPAATFHRQGRACEDCLGRGVAWPGVVRRCYHNSRAQTAVVAGMVAVHRLLGTWREQVNAYIVFTEFFRRKFVAAGLPPEKIFVKPHFLKSDPGLKQEPGSYALFVGRLAPEKGILTLLKAWRNLKHIPLQIIGDGQLRSAVHEFQQDNPSVGFLQHLPQKECLDLIKGARFLVWPSEGYNESFGLVAIEAFACGTPVIAARSGAMQELVEDRKSGLHFEPGNSEDLAAKVEWAWTHAQEMETMGRVGRAEYLSKYPAASNYEVLMEIYNKAMQVKTFHKDKRLAVCPSMQRENA